MEEGDSANDADGAISLSGGSMSQEAEVDDDASVPILVAVKKSPTDGPSEGTILRAQTNAHKLTKYFSMNDAEFAALSKTVRKHAEERSSIMVHAGGQGGPPRRPPCNPMDTPVHSLTTV